MKVRNPKRITDELKKLQLIAFFKGHPIKTLVIQSLQHHLVRCHFTQLFIIILKIQLLCAQHQLSTPIKELTEKKFISLTCLGLSPSIT